MVSFLLRISHIGFPFMNLKPTNLGQVKIKYTMYSLIVTSRVS